MLKLIPDSNKKKESVELSNEYKNALKEAKPVLAKLKTEIENLEKKEYWKSEKLMKQFENAGNKYQDVYMKFHPIWEKEDERIYDINGEGVKNPFADDGMNF